MSSNVLLVRAFKTFVQAFVASLAVSLTGVVNLAAGKQVLIAAIAAGVSALMNLFIQPTEAK